MVKSRPFHLMPWPQGPSCTASLHCSRPVPWSHVQAVYKAFTAQSCVRWTKGVVGPLEESDCTACMLSYPTRQCIRICKPSRLPSFTARVRSCKYCLLLLSPLAEQQFLTFDDCSFLVEELLKQGKQGPEAFWGGGGAPICWTRLPRGVEYKQYKRSKLAGQGSMLQKTASLTKRWQTADVQPGLWAPGPGEPG